MGGKSLGHLLTKLRSASADELWTRGRQALGKRLDGARYTVLKRGPTLRRSNGQGPGAFFFDPADVPQMATVLRDRFPEIVEALVERADRIVAGEMPILGLGDVPFGSPPDWHAEPLRGLRIEPVPWHRVPYLDFDAVGDHKITWEPNRHQHLVTLARAWAVSEDPAYARELVEQLRDWWDENPYPLGINWTSALEVAFRCISWAWIAHLMDGCESLSREFRARLQESMALGAWYVERYLSTYFAPNTHLIGEAFALFLVGHLCPGYARAERWRSLGWSTLCDELQRQVPADGFYFEQSTYYHVYALDFFLHARVFAERNGVPIPPHYDDTLARMARALCELSCGGAVVRWGDDDGGRLFDPSRNRNRHLVDPLTTGAILMDDASLKSCGGAVTEEALWLFGLEGLERFDALPAATQDEAPLLLADCGAHVIPLAPSAKVVLDTGPHGYGNGGHGHADALAVNLLLDGTHALGDPGTGVYPVADSRRNAYRGTAAHNTVQVDQASQAVPVDSFSWHFPPSTDLQAWSPGPEHTWVAASHDGYERLDDPVRHHRDLVVIRSGIVLVHDRLDGAGEHALLSSWHSGPGYSVSVTEGRADLVHDGGARWAALWVPGEDDWDVALEDASWSEAYGHDGTAPVLRCRRVGSVPARMVFVAVTQGYESARLTRVDAGGSGPRGYRVSREGSSVWFWLRSQAGPWVDGPLETDAAVVCLESDDSSPEARLTAFGATTLRVDGLELGEGGPGPDRLQADGAALVDLLQRVGR